MKKIKALFWKLLFSLSLKIHQRFSMMHMSAGTKHTGWEWSFFHDLGPKLMIVRDNKLWYLGSAFMLVIKKDKDGKIMDCRLRCQYAQKEDKVFWWHDNVYKNYPKYSNQRGVVEFT